MQEPEKCPNCCRPLRAFASPNGMSVCYATGSEACRVVVSLNSVTAALESLLSIFDAREPMSPLQMMELRTARAVLEHVKEGK